MKFVQPAEWMPHESCWLAWPSDPFLWQSNLGPAQDEFVALCDAIADVDPQSRRVRGDRLNILVPDDATLKVAERRLLGLPVTFHLLPYGDIWLRDTGPIFAYENPEIEENPVAGEDTPLPGLFALCYAFNGWGEKFILNHDSEVSRSLAGFTKTKIQYKTIILEGGSIEPDGEGTCLTTEQCLLNPNRNPNLNKEQIQTILWNDLGVQKVIWLKNGLMNDHTDGHIDTIARFTSPYTVVCMKAQSEGDPNAEVLKEIEAQLKASTDALTRPLNVHTIPSPGRLVDDEGNVLPASYVNFYIGNSTVVVPTYGSVYDEEAVSQIRNLFPNRRVVGSPALHILSGGGAFHCITNHQPLGFLKT